MSGYTYVHVWPILDLERPFHALVAQACRELDVMAQLAGAHIAGEPVWSIANGHLVCRAPAVPLDPDLDAWQEEPAAEPGERKGGRRIDAHKVEQIQSMARAGYSINAIATRLHVRWTSAKRYADEVMAA